MISPFHFFVFAYPFDNGSMKAKSTFMKNSSLGSIGEEGKKFSQ
jgi:hypothetical protein